MSVLRIEDLSIALPAGGEREYAVDGLSLNIESGQTLCGGRVRQWQIGDGHGGHGFAGAWPECAARVD